MEDDTTFAAAQQIGQPGAAAAPGPDPGLDAGVVELVGLIAARALDLMLKSGREVRAALQADPVQATVKMGTQALREVVMAATAAGQAVDFKVVLNAGLVLIREVAAVANEAGLLPDEQIEVFLKEVFQQSMREYARMDREEGLIDDQGIAMIEGDGQAQQGAAAAPAAPGEQA